MSSGEAKPLARAAAQADAAAGVRPSGWAQNIRRLIVRRGIQAVCGTPDFVSTDVAADMSLIGAGWRFVLLRAIGAVGVKKFVAKSGLGYPYVCHVGDLAEFPFYHPRPFEKELALCAGWLQGEEAPVVYDLGANVGFVSTHLAQMLASQSPRIYAFEAAPRTFEKLEETVGLLGVGAAVRPVAAAVTDGAKTVRVACPAKNSLHGQVVAEGAAPGPSSIVTTVDGVTLDDFCATTGAPPSLVKMDIEGSEVAALRGAAAMLARKERPAILFEFNPVSLGECGVSVEALIALLSDYTLYYVDDLRGQLRPFGAPVEDVGAIWWICNLFAAPKTDHAAARWAAALAFAQRRLT